MRQKHKGCSIKRSKALILSVLVVASCASRASQQDKRPGISVPDECADGNGRSQLLDVPARGRPARINVEPALRAWG